MATPVPCHKAAHSDEPKHKTYIYVEQPRKTRVMSASTQIAEAALKAVQGGAFGVPNALGYTRTSGLRHDPTTDTYTMQCTDGSHTSVGSSPPITITFRASPRFLFGGYAIEPLGAVQSGFHGAYSGFGGAKAPRGTGKTRSTRGKKGMRGTRRAKDDKKDKPKKVKGDKKALKRKPTGRSRSGR